jgi:hypothetical protein
MLVAKTSHAAQLIPNLLSLLESTGRVLRVVLTERIPSFARLSSTPEVS